MNSLKTTVAAYTLLRDKKVTERLGLDPVSACRLGLALVADAEGASSLAAVLLAKHAEGIEEVERQERYATADPGYEDGEPVVNYELTEGTRRCLRLLAALRAIANVDQSAVRAA